MKNYIFPQSILLLFLSFFLLNCGSTSPSGKSAATLRVDDEALIKNIKNEQLKNVMRQLTKGIQIEDPDYLLLALEEGTDEEAQIKILNFLITKAKTKTPPQDISPVLFDAIDRKKNKVFLFLLGRVSVDYKLTDQDRTLLHAAIATASPETVQSLLLKNSDLINKSTNTHGTALHYLLAVPFELNGKPTNDIDTRKKILELLLQSGKINLTIKNRLGHTPAQLATMLAQQNEEEAKTADTTAKDADSKRQGFYTWAAGEITAKASSKH